MTGKKKVMVASTFGPTLRKAVVDEYLAGSSSLKVAEIYGIHHTTVIGWVKAAGYDRRRPGPPAGNKNATGPHATTVTPINSVPELPEPRAHDRFLDTVIKVAPTGPACTREPEAWFSEDQLIRRAAAVICFDVCPALDACRAEVDRLEGPKAGRLDVHGIWAGENPRQRANRRNNTRKENAS